LLFSCDYNSTIFLLNEEVITSYYFILFLVA
jgi:hypothetical protein